MSPVSIYKALIVASACGLCMGFVDLAVQTSSGVPGVQDPELTLPAVAFTAGIIFTFCVALWIAFRSYLLKTFHIEPVWSLFVLFQTATVSGLWFELNAIYPFLRLSIPRNIIISSIVILLGGLAFLARRRRRNGASDKANTLMLLFPASTMVAASVLYFYINEIEARWGVGTLNIWMTLIEIAGVTIVAGTVSIVTCGPLAAFKISRFADLGTTLSMVACATLGLGSLAYLNVKYRLHWSGAGLALVPALAILTAVIGVFVASRFKGPKRVASTVFPIFFILMVFSPVALVAKDKYIALRTAPFVSSEHKVRHIIFIMVDTLRADALRCYSNSGEDTTHIDSIANDGILFQNAFADSSWTLPSVASIMTGLAPSIHRVERLRSALSPSAHTLGEYLQAKGYYTSAIGRNPILRADKGFEQGFDEYNFYMKKYPGRSLGTQAILRLFPEFYRMHATTSDLSRAASEWVETHHRKNFFLWLHFYDPHVPYEPPPDFMPPAEMPSGRVGARIDAKDILSGRLKPDKLEKEWIRALYRGEVRYVDHEIGKFLNTLKRVGIYEDALIVFLSDHGEEHWDHGRFGHGQSLYNELIHVPLIIKPPRSQASKVHRGNVSLGSLFPTVLDFLDIAYEPEDLTAKSIVTLLAADPPDELEQPVFFEVFNGKAKKEGVLFQKMKYVHDSRRGQEFLTDLESDAGEHDNIAKNDYGSLNRARKLLKERGEIVQRLRAIHRMENSTTRQLEPEAIRDLRDLGYIGN